ncbi:DUF3306 domain-containing protein [Falsiroseomonas sp.]|uniref:DUF3306 domain-containing protein n=1 Tax=Falsiroseomonas sp. TaxID=2870721 RepID=UPI0034A59AA2
MSEADAEKEGFLSRWSRRKRDAVERPLAEVAPDAPLAEGTRPEALAEDQPPPSRAACPIPEVPEIDPASLPPVESLTIESDFGQFLRPGVPTLLRNAALRRMWSLDPAIRDYIGPVEYQWDFNAAGGLPFGFSKDLVGDVSKLLAQAIGKIEELAPDDAPDDAPGQARAEAEPPGTVPEATPVPEDHVPAFVSQGSGEDVSKAETPPELLADLDPPLVPRRRHGGALPG